MQIYRGMDIGTAKVPIGEHTVPYHCIDIVDPGAPYSAALFQNDARAAIADIQSRGKHALLCGGTGFYVRAALDAMDFAPGEQDSEIRSKYARYVDEHGALMLHEHLASVDPQSAALIHPHNVKRVIRALEMHEEGESYAQRKDAFKSIPPFLPRVKLALDVDRALLYERIDGRVDEMMDDGLLDEVISLLDSGFRDGLTAPQAIGYKELVAFLDGDMTQEEAVESIKQATRRYAKRQLSWLRSDPEIIWLQADEGITDTLVQNAMSEIERRVSS